MILHAVGVVAEQHARAGLDALSDDDLPEHGERRAPEHHQLLADDAEYRDTWVWFQSGINTDGAHNWATTRKLQRGEDDPAAAGNLDPEAWVIGPVIRGRNYSEGMPLHPSPGPEGGWHIDLPRAPGSVHYVTFRHGSLAGKRRIVMRYRVETEPGARIAAPGASAIWCLPRAAVDEYVLQLLKAHHLPVLGVHPKALHTVRFPAAPKMDFIITLSAVAAEEPWADWAGEPLVAHWQVWDRDAAVLVTPEAMVRDAFWTLRRRIQIFASPLQRQLSPPILQRRARTLSPSYL